MKKGSFDALNKDALLWDLLAKESAPAWWQNILDDSELYVEVRKDNYVNVYYYGASVALIKYEKGDIEAYTHYKYLGKEKLGNKIYLNCTELIKTKEGIDSIKQAIKDAYLSKEKKVQGMLKLHHNTKYIDSEFAYKKEDGGKNNTTRIDLIELRGNTLHFVELKLIDDARLRTSVGKPEIRQQMDNYRIFIEGHEKDLKQYYSNLLAIKKKIGVWQGQTQVEEVCTTPHLLVVNTYSKPLSKGKQERVKDIKALGGECFDTEVVDIDAL
jgi:hypothetical protein